VRVRVLVTRDGSIYSISKEALSTASDLFRLSILHAEAEDLEPIIQLANVRHSTYKIFDEWLRSGSLPADNIDWDRIRISSGDEDDPMDDEPLVTALTRAYIFAYRYSIPIFQNEVRNHIMHLVLYTHIPPWLYALRLAYRKLPRGDALFTFLGDVHCKSSSMGGNIWVEDWLEDEDDEQDKRVRLEQLPQRLLRELLAGTADKVKDDPAWFFRPINPCDYHGHYSESQRKECGRRKIDEYMMDAVHEI
jgi:hypothetical protein